MPLEAAAETAPSLGREHVEAPGRVGRSRGSTAHSGILCALRLPWGQGTQAMAPPEPTPFQGLTHELLGQPRVCISHENVSAAVRMPAFLWSQSDVFNYIGQNPRRLFPWLQPVSERYLEPPSYPRTRAVSAPPPPALYRLQWTLSDADPTPTWQPPQPAGLLQIPPALPARLRPPQGRAGPPISVPGVFPRPRGGSVATRH